MSETSKEENGCWISSRCIRKDGYSALKINGQEVLAHRLSFSLFKIEIPYDKIVCHTCDRRNCVNPDHLYLGNDSLNALDRQKRNKSSCQKGEKNHRAKLTEEQAKEIKKMKKTKKEISQLYNIHTSTVAQIRSGRLWPHI
jgi:hypothetical protein